MKKITLDEAVFEARRFIYRAEALRKANMGEKSLWFYDNPKEQGAVKRASLDLTRKLADLRAGR